MKQKIFAAICAIVIASSTLLSACTQQKPVANTDDISTYTNPTDSTVDTADLITNTDTIYTYANSAIYTVGDVDFVATTKGIGIVEPGKKIRMLNNQKTTSHVTVIGDTVYYTVINTVNDAESLDVNGDIFPTKFAQCDCWSMNTDGSNPKKLFSYFGNGWVVYRQDNTVFYIDETSFEEVAVPEKGIYKIGSPVLKLRKIDLTTGKSETIAPIYSDHPGGLIWGSTCVWYASACIDGDIVIASTGMEGGTYIYDIADNEFIKPDHGVGCLIEPTRDGNLYAFKYVYKEPEDDDFLDSSYYELSRYNSDSNSFEPLGFKSYNNIGNGIKYGNNGIMFETYKNGYLFTYTPEEGVKVYMNDAINYSDGIFCDEDNNIACISSEWHDDTDTYQYLLTDYTNPENVTSVTLKEFNIRNNYSMSIGANTVIGLYTPASTNKSVPANFEYSDYTIVYR